MPKSAMSNTRAMQSRWAPRTLARLTDVDERLGGQVAHLVGAPPADPGVEHRYEHVVAALGDAPRQVEGRALLAAQVLRGVEQAGARVAPGGALVVVEALLGRDHARRGLVGRAVAPVRAVEGRARRGGLYARTAGRSRRGVGSAGPAPGSAHQTGGREADGRRPRTGIPSPYTIGPPRSACPLTLASRHASRCASGEANERSVRKGDGRQPGGSPSGGGVGADGLGRGFYAAGTVTHRRDVQVSR